jgi:ornithine cyclodeaminase
MTEDQSRRLVTRALAYAAAREAYIAADDPLAQVFPAVIAHGSDPGNRFSIKSGATADLAGLKIGSYWPANAARGMPNHSSTILLMDQATGRIAWAIEAGEVNAYRTAAADAVAADALARRDASVLAIFGAGRQALHECVALAEVRPLTHILVVARSHDRGQAFVKALSDLGFNATLSNAEEACVRADIVVTVTAATAPLFEAEWIRPGTHVASMGSDAKGKQELPPALFDRASLFCDLPAQAVVLGELQHFSGDATRITPIGRVLSGQAPGRKNDQDITVFDSSGIALQDLYMARKLVLARAA